MPMNIKLKPFGLECLKEKTHHLDASKNHNYRNSQKNPVIPKAKTITMIGV